MAVPRKIDVIVIGGGPTGIMAAGRAAELGAKVLLIEKGYRIGSKLLITGGNRCNITNSAGMDGFVRAFGAAGNGKFLYRALTAFSNKDLISFFAKRGLSMRTDPDGKVFPADDKAESVLAVLRAYVEENKVRIMHNTAVAEIVLSEDGALAAGVKLANGDIIRAEKIIVATGGMSYPKTGSTGDGYKFAKQCGHNITTLRPGLVPLISDEPFIKDLQGVVLKDVGISLVVDGKKIRSLRGDLLFTHYGVSGPDVLILSSEGVDHLAAGRKTELFLNFLPDNKPGELESILQARWTSSGNKTFRNYLKDIFPSSFAGVFEAGCGLKDGLKCNMINREARKRIAGRFGDFRVNITGARPIEEATITKGGVTLDEIDPRTMGSKLVKNLYFCGEVLDLDGITGGYNLQEAFSTGYLAGGSVIARPTS